MSYDDIDIYYDGIVRLAKRLGVDTPPTKFAWAFQHRDFDTFILRLIEALTDAVEKGKSS